MSLWTPANSESGMTTDVGSSINRVSPGYFGTMDIPILSGRDFDDRDTMWSRMVAIVNQTFAQRLTGGADPVGRRFRIEATPTTPEVTYEIVGLARRRRRPRDRPGRRQARGVAALRHHAARARDPGDRSRGARGGRTARQLLAGAGCYED
jgi:hypothetical protein